MRVLDGDTLVRVGGLNPWDRPSIAIADGGTYPQTPKFFLTAYDIHKYMTGGNATMSIPRVPYTWGNGTETNPMRWFYLYAEAQ